MALPVYAGNTVGLLCPQEVPGRASGLHWYLEAFLFLRECALLSACCIVAAQEAEHLEALGRYEEAEQLANRRIEQQLAKV